MTTITTRLTEQAVIPLRTLDPAAPLDDLDWLDEAIGDARVVAIGESAHYNREFLQLRHRLLRYLAERHGFSAYTLESGFVEGWAADAWVRGGDGTLGDVLANGMTSLMGPWKQLRAQLEWMREHNRTATRPVGFYGIDVPGSVVSALPGLDAVIAYLAEADPAYEVDPAIRETAAAFAVPSAFSALAAITAYAELAPERRDALTAGLADLTARMTGRRLDYLRLTSVDAYERAAHSLRVTVTLDAMVRDLPRGDRYGMMLNRDTTIADTVEWILKREDRIVLAAHNGHVQRRPMTMPGLPPVTTAGMHLAERLGDAYLAIGTTSATGQSLNTDPGFYTGRLFAEMPPPEPGSLDALMAASHDGPFATDLRRLAPTDAAAVRDASRHRAGTFYTEQNPLESFDVIVHLPHVTPADADEDALAHAPDDVREPFAGWRALSE